MAAIKVNNISDYRQVSDLINAMNGTKDDMQVQKNQLLSLFEGSFLKMGANSNEAKVIGSEIEEIEALIAKEEAQMKVWERAILEDQEQIGKAQEALENLMADHLKRVDSEYQEARNGIQEITRDVINEYAMGIIKDPEEVSKTIQNRVASEAAPQCNFPAAQVATLTAAIQSHVDDITGLIDKFNMHNAKLSTSYAALQLLNEMYQMQMEVPTGKQVTEKAGKVPVYTPEKQALVDQFYAKYHATATAGVDQFSIANVQVRNIGAAIGIGQSDATTDTGAYTLSPVNNTADIPASQRTNLYEGSILQEMFNAGFTYKEAMYACQYIFGTSSNLLSYNLGTDRLRHANGHAVASSYYNNTHYETCDALVILDSFENQARALWGRDKEVEDGGGGGDVTPTVPSEITDPIGWTEGNVTFDFVVDRNGNNLFDDKNEFLGANGQIQEFVNLEKQYGDGDGIFTADEMHNAGIMLLRTDHEVQGFGFLTVKDAGIKEIDLNSIQNVSSQHADVNGNTLQTTFDIKFEDDSKKTGRQSLDDNSYLNAVFGARFGKDMILSIDFTNNEDNKKAKDDIKNFNVSFDQTKKEEAEAQRDAILGRYKDKKAEVEKEVKAQERELVQDLNREERLADLAVDRIDEKRTEEEDNAEYQKRNLEGRLTALRNRKSTIETELKNLYNKDEETYNARKAELEADLVSVKQQIEQLSQQLPKKVNA